MKLRSRQDVASKSAASVILLLGGPTCRPNTYQHANHFCSYVCTHLGPSQLYWLAKHNVASWNTDFLAATTSPETLNKNRPAIKSTSRCTTEVLCIWDTILHFLDHWSVFAFHVVTENSHFNQPTCGGKMDFKTWLETPVDTCLFLISSVVFTVYWNDLWAAPFPQVE